MNPRKYPMPKVGSRVAVIASPDLPVLLDVREAAEFLKTSSGAIRNLIWRGRIRVYKPGRKNLIRKEDLLRFLESSRK